MDAELLLNDQIKIEAKLARLQEDSHKGGHDKGEIERETKLFAKLNETLQQEKPLRILTLDEEEERLIQGFGFLTRKPMLVVLNLSEGQTVPQLSDAAVSYKLIPLQGKIEMEIAQLPEEEAQMFLQEYGIEEPGLNRMIRESYELLGLLSFFTAGEKEVHAWTVHKGATAPEAAGTIHSDMQQGFIRAEIMAYEDLMDAGSIAELRNRGKLRVEGKNYIIQDGDIIEIRFNI
jgi:ribosome-binding ATPase YchF (GTP1/OBG family)